VQLDYVAIVRWLTWNEEQEIREEDIREQQDTIREILCDSMPPFTVHE
jgi:hypothetical protein